MQRRHSMPFGAEVTAEGVRFRLWAPAARAVALCLAGGVANEGDLGNAVLPMTALPMTKLKDGWFETLTREAEAGSRYRYRIDNGIDVPDPASRFNPDDVHGASEVIDPAAFVWHDADWRGRPWQEAVIYELHVGTFTQAGTFLAAIERFDYLLKLGVTAIELMPVADFPGTHNWGYDGVLLFAPDASYGRPEDLRALIDAAHARGLMVFLDVVYNHFGPEGNYLHAYAPQFFTERHHTPWGAAINFDDAERHVVRDFYIHNALYWLTEFHFDGLRLDAVHTIIDDSTPHILEGLTEAVAAGPGGERQVHLILENEDNVARYLERDAGGRPRCYTAQWNDDIHHALHVLATGETDGFYTDYGDRPVALLGRCLAEGFAFQGEASPFRGGAARGEASAHLPPAAFIAFLQNHDQIGNRAMGERLATIADPVALRALTAVLLLAPSPPLIFMGEEFAARQPFQFFCNFQPDLARLVTEGRRREFGRFARFADSGAQEAIPDPGDPATFARSKLVWEDIDASPHDDWLELYRTLLTLRHKFIVPRLAGMTRGAAYRVFDERALRVDWRLAGAARLTLLGNFSATAAQGIARPKGELIYASDVAYMTDLGVIPGVSGDELPAWSVAWFLDEHIADESAATESVEEPETVETTASAQVAA